MIKAALFFAAVSGSAWAGWEWRDRSADLELSEYLKAAADQRAQAESDARRQELALYEAAGRVDQLTEALRAERQRANEIVEIEVVRYVEVHGDDDCGLDSDWVRVHDSSTGDSSVPGDSVTASGADERAATASKADALHVVTGNYAEFNAVRDQVIGLQAYINSVCLATNTIR